MENQYVMGCPECIMSLGINSPVSKTDEHFQCSTNPAHRFRLGEDGFLKSL